MTLIYLLFNWFVKITAWIPQLFVFRTKVYYEDKAIQSKRIRGKAIVISNHNQIMDFAVLMFVFWRRTLRCVAAEVLYRKNFAFSFLLKALGCIRVDRSANDFSFMTKLKKVLDKNGVVEIYPEARIPNKGESRPLEFKPSYIYLAMDTGAPIIPIYSNSKIFCRERERLIIGKPIYVEELYDSDLSEAENINNINQHIRSKIIELGKELEKRETEEKAVL